MKSDKAKRHLHLWGRDLEPVAQHSCLKFCRGLLQGLRSVVECCGQDDVYWQLAVECCRLEVRW